MEIERILAALQAREPKSLTGNHFRPAAVLIPIQQREDGNHLVLTVRAEGLNSHSGQVAFPGGGIDPTDVGPLEAALRESREEVGINPGDVHILGQLDQVTAAASYLVTPFVGVIPYPYDFRLKPHETTAVFSVPISALLDRECMSVDSASYRPRGPIYHFKYQEWDIWGATARMILQLLEIAYDYKP